jgi:hypothetical protein
MKTRGELMREYSGGWAVTSRVSHHFLRAATIAKVEFHNVHIQIY